MSRTVRMLVASALGVLGLGAMAGPAQAGIWAEIPSGTTAEITAIEYQSPTRFWFTTSTGEIWKRRADLSGFDRVRNPTFVALNDIEFQAGGNIGLAVGDDGTVVRSINGGASWGAVINIPVSNLGDGSGNKCTTTELLGDVNFVRFAGSGRVWIGAERRQIAKSQPASPANVGATGTWTDANRKPVPDPGNNCWIQQSDGFADMFVTPNPDVFFIGTGQFDEVVFSSNNLTGTPQTKPAEVANGFELSGSMAGDPLNPSRMWAVSGAPYSNSTAQYTEDGYATSHWFHVVNEESHDFPNYGAYDVDYAGGTVLSAGNAGYILHSINGRDFFWNGADGALATHDWRAVALASATQGAVGGLGGRLVITSQANVPPDVVKPTGTISGPSSVIAGQAATFTLNAADTGGSGLNPASYRWSATGLADRTGQTVALTFPNSGSATIRVTFADRAGNVATATKFVSINLATGGGGSSSLPVRFTGRGNELTAKIVGRRVRIRARGTITLPAGAPLSACSGKVKLTIKRKRKTLATRSARLRVRNGKCRFGKTIFLKRKKVGRSTTRLRLKVSFRGNAVLKAGSTTKTLVIRK